MAEKFADYAPTLAGAGVTKTYVESITPDPSPEPKPAPKITKAKAEKILNEVRDVEKHNGFTSIARNNKVEPYQVKAIYEEWKRTLAKKAQAENNPEA